MEIVEPVPANLWDRVAARCPCATFFHSRAWSEIWEKSHPGIFRSAARAVVFGHEGAAVLPLMEYGWEGKGFFHAYASNAPGVYGGVIAEREAPEDSSSLLVGSLRGARSKRIDFFGNPYDDRNKPPAGWERRPNFTHRIDLSRFSGEEDLFKSYSHGPRQLIRKAVDLGYTFAEARNLDDVRAYYQLYRKVLTAWGDEATNDYGFDLFKNIFLRRDAGTSFRLVWKGDELVAGQVALTFNGICDAWHAVNDRRHVQNGVSSFVVHHSIQAAMKDGCRYFDLNPSGGHAGTATFKERMGAVKTPFEECGWGDNGVYRSFCKFRRVLPHD
jgi:hypothetical protein